MRAVALLTILSFLAVASAQCNSLGFSDTLPCSNCDKLRDSTSDDGLFSNKQSTQSINMFLLFQCSLILALAFWPSICRIGRRMQKMLHRGDKAPEGPDLFPSASSLFFFLLLFLSLLFLLFYIAFLLSGGVHVSDT